MDTALVPTTPAHYLQLLTGADVPFAINAFPQLYLNNGNANGTVNDQHTTASLAPRELASNELALALSTPAASLSAAFPTPTSWQLPQDMNNNNSSSINNYSIQSIINNNNIININDSDNCDSAYPVWYDAQSGPLVEQLSALYACQGTGGSPLLSTNMTPNLAVLIEAMKQQYLQTLQYDLQHGFQVEKAHSRTQNEDNTGFCATAYLFEDFLQPYSSSKKMSEKLSKEPYQKLINRPRRMRRGKVYQTRDVRQCNWCHKDQTPQWRIGPFHTVLCNACGLQYKNQIKKEKQNKEKNAITNLLN